MSVKTWNPISIGRYRLPPFLRLEVLGPDGKRYPARLAGRRVAGACGPIGRSVPVRLIPRRPLLPREREQAVGLARLLQFAGYLDVRLDQVDRRPYEEQPAVAVLRSRVRQERGGRRPAFLANAATELF